MDTTARASRTPSKGAAAAVAAAHASVLAEINPVSAAFPPTRAIFEDDVRNPDKPWNDGTISQTIASASLELGDSGVYIPSCRVVMKTLPRGGGKRLDLQLPSSGQQFRHSMLKGGSERAKKLLEDWKREVCNVYKAWRIEARKNGAAPITGVTANVGIAVDDDMLSELGVLVGPDAIQPPAPKADPAKAAADTNVAMTAAADSSTT